MNNFKLMAVALTFFFGVNIAYSQIPEPDFVGEVYLIGENESVTLVDYDVVSLPSSTTFVWDYTKLIIPGKYSTTEFDASEEIKLVVRAPKNNVAPNQAIKIFEVVNTGKNRKLKMERNRFNRHLDTKENTKSQVPVRGMKHGKYSYIITLKNMNPGEYAIVVENPYATSRDDKNVTTFRIK